jgi:hypothetical protein
MGAIAAPILSYSFNASFELVVLLALAGWR